MRCGGGGAQCEVCGGGGVQCEVCGGCMQHEGGSIVACDGSDERFHDDCILKLESEGWVHVRTLVFYVSNEQPTYAAVNSYAL